MTELGGKGPGDWITFGAWPQRGGSLGTQGIQWRVLENTGKELFLLSEYSLDCKRYHEADAEITWRDCSLRLWLREEFYQRAFSAGEQERIATTLCTDNGEGCPDTWDKVFLLSVSEARALTGKWGAPDTKVSRRTVGTDYAREKKADGCHLYAYDLSAWQDHYLPYEGKRVGCSWWWLRTRGNSPSRAYFIGQRDSVRSYGAVNLARDGVRPALKLSY